MEPAQRALFLPTPVEVAAKFGGLWVRGQLSPAFSESLVLLGGGFLLAIVAAVPLGLLVGRYQVLSHLSEVWVNVLYVMPFVALLPLVIIYFGVGFQAKLVLVLIASFFPLLINTQAGVRNLDAVLLEVAKSFGASEAELLRKIVLPGSVPFIVAGLRIALGRAIVGTVVAEMFLGISGLGGLLFFYANQLDTGSFLAPLILLAAISIGMAEGVRQLERHVASWKVVS